MSNSVNERLIRVAEIFGPTIQGEGVLIGQPTVFVRTGGCDYRCSWCDSLHAVEPRYKDEWQGMSSAAVFQEIQKLSGNKPLMVSLSGGNPAIQPLGNLIDLGHEKNYRFALETQGSIAQDWFAKLDVLVLSPKPPSSEMAIDWQALNKCIAAANNSDTPPHTILKIVIFDDIDFEWAHQLSSRYPQLEMYLQPGNPSPAGGDEMDAPIDTHYLQQRMLWLVDKVNAAQWFDARVLPQLHVILWGNLRGV